LQDFHLAPPACLRRLHDTHLKPTHIPLRGPPIDGRQLSGLREAAPTVVAVVICFAS
jgi:hypothetical protein